MNQKYRSKPIEIEAFQVTDAFLAKRKRTSQSANNGFILPTETYECDGKTLQIIYLPQHVIVQNPDGGTSYAYLGDWIITGTKGEKYACPNDVFQLKYEAVQPTPTTTERPLYTGPDRNPNGSF